MQRRARNEHAPDRIDCLNLERNIAEEFNLSAVVTITFEVDFVLIIGRLHKPAVDKCDGAEYVSLTRLPYKAPKSLDSAIYTTLWDLFWQADRGVAGKRPVPESAAVGWDGVRRAPRRW